MFFLIFFETAEVFYLTKTKILLQFSRILCQMLRKSEMWEVYHVVGQRRRGWSVWKVPWCWLRTLNTMFFQKHIRHSLELLAQRLILNILNFRRLIMTHVALRRVIVDLSTPVSGARWMMAPWFFAFSVVRSTPDDISLEFCQTKSFQKNGALFVRCGWCLCTVNYRFLSWCIESEIRLLFQLCI